MGLLPWTLAWVRMRKHALRTFTFAIALTLALIALFSLQGVTQSTNSSLISYSLSKLATGDQTLTLTSNKIHSTPDQYLVNETYLSKNLYGITDGPLTRELLYNEISDQHGIGFYFAGLENLAHSIHLTSGRLPFRCDATVCEVIQIGGQSGPSPRPYPLGLVITGTGIFNNNLLFTGTMAPTSGIPILVADGITKAGALPHFQAMQGATAWVRSINLNKIGKVGVDAYIQSILSFENQLSIDHPDITLTWPQDSLGQAGDKIKAVSVNFALLNLVIVSLLFAFLILFALRHRIEHGQFRAGLSRIGTPQKVLSMELGMEYGLSLLLGLLLALPISLFVPKALLWAHFRANLGQVYLGWPDYLLLVLASIGLVVASSIVGDRAWRRKSWIPIVLSLFCIFGYLVQFNSHEIGSRLLSYPLTFFSR